MIAMKFIFIPCALKFDGMVLPMSESFFVITKSPSQIYSGTDISLTIHQIPDLVYAADFHAGSLMVMAVPSIMIPLRRPSVINSGSSVCSFSRS